MVIIVVIVIVIIIIITSYSYLYFALITLITFHITIRNVAFCQRLYIVHTSHDSSWNRGGSFLAIGETRRYEYVLICVVFSWSKYLVPMLLL